MEEIVAVLEKIADGLLSPSVTDWTMVIVTIIYAVTTVIMCIFNHQSAKAAKEQLVESHKQLEIGIKQQRQNAGIQLYELRKKILIELKNENIDIEEDVLLLFDETIYAMYKNLVHRIYQYKLACEDLKYYESQVREISHDDQVDYMNPQAINYQYSFFEDEHLPEGHKMNYQDIKDFIDNALAEKNAYLDDLIREVQKFIKNSIT